MKTLLLLILLSVNSYSQEYVTPEELEEGWGFGYTHPLWSVESFPKTIITDFRVSKDETKLFVRFSLEYYNPKNIVDFYFDFIKKEFIQEDWKIKSSYSQTSNIFTFFDEIEQKLYLDINGNELILNCEELLVCDDNNLQLCSIGEHIVSNQDGNFSYLTLKNEQNKVDIYRVNLDSLLESKCPRFELVNKTEITKDSLIFPMNSISNFIVPKSKYLNISGFDIYKNFEYIKSIEIPKKSDWQVTNKFDAFHYYFRYFNRKNNIKLGISGDVYYYTSFRSESEPNSSDNYKPENHPEAKEARDASGIYRIDTNGHNPVQLVRSWTNHPGGLQISGDGETIYYAYILPDSTSAIMKMDRYGKNKEIVFKLDPAVLSVEAQTPKQKIYPNPASEYVTISGIGNGKAIIYNSIGQKLIEQDITSTSEINISNLQSGIYIIKLENAGNITFEKLMVGR